MKCILRVLLALIVFSSCGSDEPQSGTLFSKVSPSKTGIHFSNTLKDDVASDYNILSYDYFNNGAGVAAGDLNNDGLTDLVFTANMGADKVYINQGNFKFKDISKQASFDKFDGWSTGANIVDVNNDGYQDIYICRAGPEDSYDKRRNLLFINNKDLTFTERAKEFGLDDDRLGTQAVFFDYNRDGRLDCFIINESKFARTDLTQVNEAIKDEKVLAESSSCLYANVNGKFIDVSKQAGILKYGYGLGVCVSDLNNDFWPDIYVANDYSAPDIMWINQKNGTFKDEIAKRTDHTSWFSMGVDIADINNDGLSEIAVVDMASKDHFLGKTLMAPMNPALFEYTMNTMGHHRQHMFNALQFNNGDGDYSNLSGIYDIQQTEWSWTSLLADLDNDGDKDYYVTNGYKTCHRDNDFRLKLKEIRAQNNGDIPQSMRQKVYDQIPSYRTKNLVYKNDGFAEFSENSEEWGLGDASYTNGALYADLDNDGDLDIVTNNIDDKAFVYRNNSTNNYIRFDFSKKSKAIGTKIKVYSDSLMQYQEYYPVRGYQSKMEDIVHFGLGSLDQVDSIVINWPNQKTQIISKPAINQTITLTPSKDASNSGRRIMKQDRFMTPVAHNMAGHIENNYNDFANEVLLPYKQSTLGPFLSVGDVNGDKLDDVFIGGSKGQQGMLYVQIAVDNWKQVSSATFSGDRASEDMKSEFVDVDADGDLDLYVVSGGNEFGADDSELGDRLYLNDGKGNFTKSSGKIPNMKFVGMHAESIDIDADGDSDLIVSGRHKMNQYPFANPSIILQNNSGRYVQSEELSDTSFVSPKLVNDQIAMDIDQDGDLDLVRAVEWGAIEVFENQNGKLSAKESNIDQYTGLWFSLSSFDVDNDGDLDIVAGNLGLNSKFKASADKPLKLYASDFDENGSCDVVLSKQYKGKEVPVRGRQCSSEQMPFITDKYKSYEAFATADIYNIFGKEKVSNSLSLDAKTFESSVFINDGSGNFTRVALPKQAQTFPVFGIVHNDINKDGYQDIILTGNLYDMEIETPRLDSGRGCLLLNDKSGGFVATSFSESNLKIDGDMRNAQTIRTQNGLAIIVALNSDIPKIYNIN